jgi:hypothetical protein
MRRISLNIGLMLAGLLVGGIFGYHFKTFEFVPLSSVPELDYFVADDSFSEIQNAKATLTGLSARFLTELQIYRYVQLNAREGKPKAVNSHCLAYGGQMIAQLERGIEEFSGTEEELTLTRDLLRVLRADGRYDQWLRTYLCLVYTHPTNSLVGSCAGEAIEIGERLGRRQEVIDGLEHVISIPLDFQNKIRLQTALLQTSPTPVCCSLESVAGTVDAAANTQVRLMQIHPAGPVIARSVVTESNKWLSF